MYIFDIVACEQKIGYSFKDKMLLRQCFTHASYANEHNQQDNERLEFFGDAIIEFVVTEHLFKNAIGDEGKLTQKRALIVSKVPLLNAVKKLGLIEFVLLGKGQEKAMSKDEKLFSSIYEALVAGIYLDGGMVAVKRFIKRTIIADYEAIYKNLAKNNGQTKADEKSMFQEYVQKYKLGTIGYETLWKKGPDHKPEFCVAALLNSSRIAEGEGKSKKEAQANAARKALETIKQQGGKNS